MDKWRTEWVENKIKTALSLNSGGCGGTYGEAVIILCSALSALAAEVWPGRQIDRFRFIELIVRFSPHHLESTKISIPILIKYLCSKKMKSKSEKVENKFLNFGDSMVLLGDKIDKFDSEIQAVCNTLSFKEIRECSYPSLLYKEIRSNYVHEYCSGDHADSIPMTSKIANVSYVNWVDDPHRRIHFHIDWIVSITIEIAKAVDAISSNLPHKLPSCWWIEG